MSGKDKDDIGDAKNPGGPGRTEYAPIGEPKDKDIYVPSKDSGTSNGGGNGGSNGGNTYDSR